MRGGFWGPYRILEIFKEITTGTEAFLPNSLPLIYPVVISFINFSFQKPGVVLSWEVMFHKPTTIHKEGNVIVEEMITESQTEPSQESADGGHPTFRVAVILLPAVVRSEVNFLRFPFFALSLKGLRKKKETVYRFVEERDGKRAEFEWRVMANATYGYPTPFDWKVARAVDAVIDETIARNGSPLENPIQFSIYRLVELMGMSSRGGRNYHDIRESIERIVATTVKSEGSFFLKGEKRWLGDIFHLYDRAVFKGKEMPDGIIAETNSLWLSDPYLHNINARYVRPLDYRFLAELKRPLAGRLYEVLSAKFYGLEEGKDYYHVDYQDLCKILPITPQRYFSDVQRDFKRAHEELGAKAFLAKVAYVLYDGSKEVKTVRYYPGEKAKRERNGELLRLVKTPMVVEEQLPLPQATAEQEKAVELTGIAKELYSRGVLEKVAVRLAQRYSEDRIREKVEMFDFLKSSSCLENPAGWLITAIEEDWKPSSAQLKAKALAERFGAREKIAQLNREKEEIQKAYSEKAEAILFEILEREKEAVEKAVIKLLAENPSLLQWYDESKGFTEQRAMVQATVRIHLREKFPDAFLAITAERDEKMSEMDQQIAFLEAVSKN